MPRQTNIQIRRGTASDWEVANPTLAAGEIAMETDTRKIKVGDGSTAWNALRYVSLDGGNLDGGVGGGSPTTTTAAPTTTTAAPTTTTAAPTTTTAAPGGFSPMAVLLTNGTSYNIPQGATSMKAWAVGAGGPAGAGGVAYKTWSVTGGSSVSYSVGAIGVNPGYGNIWPYLVGQGSTVTYGGVTIYGNGAGTDGQNPGTYSGGDGGSNGGATGYTLDHGYYTSSGGGLGGSGWPNSVQTSCGRFAANDVSGLLAAVDMAGGTTTETCSATAAFGSGAASPKFGANLSAGLGGGGAALLQGYVDAGPGAVVLYFT